MEKLSNVVTVLELCVSKIKKVSFRIIKCITPSLITYLVFFLFLSSKGVYFSNEIVILCFIQVIAYLLRPRGWKPPVRRQFFLDCNEIADLCDSAERMFSNEPSVLQIKSPVKIFGDLHGQFGDLMRLFDEYGAPSTAGDIA